MQAIHTFTKDSAGWFISSIPKPHPFSRGALAMVAGADTFLDIISQGESEVTLSLAVDPHEGWNQLERTAIHGIGFSGADYIIKEYGGIEYNHTMWLCPVTLYVFGGYYPSTIFFQVH